MFKHRKGAADNQLIAYALIGLAIFLVWNGTKGGTSGGDNKYQIDITGANVADTTTLVLGNAVNRFTPTTFVTTAFHRYILNGQDQGLKVDGTSVTVSPGDNVRIITCANSTASYYAGDISFTVGNSGAETASALKASTVVSSETTGGAFKLVAWAEPTITVFNENDAAMSASANPLALGAAEVVCTKVRIKGSSATTGYSPFASPEVVCSMHKYWLDDVYLTDMDGNRLPAGVALQQHTITTSAGEQAANYTTTQYVIDPILGNPIRNYQICFDTDDTNAPGVGANTTCTLYDQNVYKNSLSGAIGTGYETNTGADVGDTTASTFVVYTS